MLRMMLIEMNMSGTFLIYFISITCVRLCLCVCRRLAVTAQKSQMRWSWLALHSWVSLDSITAATGEEVGRGYADVCVWMDWALQELAGGLVLRWIAPLQTSWFLIQLLFTPLHPSSSSWRKIAPIQSNTALLYTHAPSLRAVFPKPFTKHSNTHFPEFNAGAHHLRRQASETKKEIFLGIIILLILVFTSAFNKALYYYYCCYYLKMPFIFSCTCRFRSVCWL